MNFFFIAQKETVIKKGDIAEVNELLKARKLKYVITNPKYKDSDARLMWERGHIHLDIKRIELKIVTKDFYNSVEVNGKVVSLRKTPQSGTGKRR